MDRGRSFDDIDLGRSSSHDDGPEERYRDVGRSVSAPRERGGTERQRMHHMPINRPINLPGRSQGRLVFLGPGWVEPALFSDPLPPDALPEPVPSHFQGPGLTVRVRCYCVGEAFDRSKLQDQILKRSSASSVRAYPEVLCSTYHVTGDAKVQGDIFYYDWGCVVFWGLDKSAERHILREIAEPCVAGGEPLPPERRERDRLRVLYTASPKTVMENDTLALHFRFATDFEVKMAVSFALAQSTKLSAAEEDLRRMGKRLAYVPGMLAESGEVPPERDTLRAIGRLYKQMAAVTLLGAALDLPDAMDSAPSNIRELYKATYDYLEVAERLNLVNERFGILREMLEICRTLGQQAHYTYLESIIMWLVGVCSFLAVLQLIAFLNWKPSWRE